MFEKERKNLCVSVYVGGWVCACLFLKDLLFCVPMCVCIQVQSSFRGQTHLVLDSLELELQAVVGSQFGSLEEPAPTDGSYMLFIKQ